ncbi:MAG: hypothetical protein HC875_37915 [Anaerolineales bacterium]|nr:hypothetical protein [Anaerolineales bacterium]
MGLVSLAVLLLLYQPQPANSAPLLQGSSLTIYAEGLPAGWESWSWDTTVNFNGTSPVHSGSAALAATFNQAWAGVYLHRSSNISGSSYDTLQFWIHGGSSSAHSIQVKLADGSNNLSGSAVSVTASANTWTHVSIPLSNLGGLATISGVAWQDSGGSSQPTFYLDDVTLLNSGATPPPPSGGPSLTINAAADQHAISPYIYGLNFADSQLAADLRLPVNRWGGNSTTRYNWKLDVHNTGSDYYFENIPEENDNLPALPNGSAADDFIDANQASDTETLLTVPLIGWTPKRRLANHPYDCGFKVSSYGVQQSVDPWDTDCGNGRYANGTAITGNNPLDTSQAITETFVQDWLTHLKGRYGAANAGGVKFYNLDNEPMLWPDTHRDVHPQPTSYDEMRDRTYQYAAAIKATDPTAQTLGPVLWGWTAYFYSALDQAPGGAWWNNPQDRNAHGGTPFVEWYLQQMKAYEQAHGVRLLDYLDLHYYPQANVALQPAGDATTQAKRLRSTRSLWDTTYGDESWINEAVYLIPRMRAWVNTYYPGTKLAISEYNWGALDHINGALAQADVLGIFGRESLDLATLWAPPDFDEPGAFAFRMYRNYDGAGGSFGDVSVSASSSDQEQLSVYAARRSQDDRLTVMVINKSGTALHSAISLSGFSSAANAAAYRYSAANLSAIVHLPDQAVGASFEADFPANSITLFVLSPQSGSPASNFIYLPTILSE